MSEGLSMLDMHCHILPRVDDGAKKLKQAERMLALARNAGVTEIVATPHLYSARPDHLFKVNRAFAMLSMRARSYGIRLYLGYEVMFDNIGAFDVSKYCYRWNKPIKVFLLEFMPYEYPKDADMRICDWINSGITPVIAHPERYKFVQDDIHFISYLKGYGCLIQVDARAFEKPFYSTERKTALALVKAGLVDSISSDAHDAKHYIQYAKVLKKLGTNWTPFDFDSRDNSINQNINTSVV